MPEPNHAEPDERALIERFLVQRDEATFREIYCRQAPAMYRIAARLTLGSSVRADDVIQETWLRAISALPRFRHESSLRTWLVGFAVNVVREMQRPRAEVISFESLTDELESGEPDPALLAERDLTPQLRELPEGFRTVLVLHDLEGLTHAEIASALGISAGTAKSQLSRARAAIRSLLSVPTSDGARRNP